MRKSIAKNFSSPMFNSSENSFPMEKKKKKKKKKKERKK